MSNKFFIADVLSLQRDDIIRSTTIQSSIQTLNLFISLFHLSRAQSTFVMINVMNTFTLLIYDKEITEIILFF